MNAIEIVELILRILSMVIVSAGVICIVVYGAQTLADGVDTRKNKK